MHFNKKLAVGILLVFMASTAFAGPSFRGFYFGGSLARHDIKDIDEKFNGAMVKVGYDLTNFLGIEAHGGASTTQNYIDAKVNVQHAGIYARLNWRETNSMVYALVGYGKYKILIDYEGPVDSYDIDLDGVSYGIGAELFGSGRTSVTANWMQLIKEKDEFDYEWDAQVVYLGITYYFSPQKTTFAPY